MDVSGREARLLDAQAAIVGSILIKPEIAAEVFATIPAEDFTLPQYRKIYDACREIQRGGDVPDAILLAGKLGEAYKQTLIECMTVTPSASRWRAYAAQLREDSTLSRIRELGMQLTGAANTDEAAEIIRKAAELFDRRTENRTMSIQTGLAELIQRMKDHTPPQYIKIGFKDLDECSFISPGDYAIIGGYPSSGKTALALQMALALAREHNVGFFSLETSPEKLMDRAAACYAQVNFTDVKKRTLRDVEIQRIEKAANIVQRMNYRLSIEQASRMTVQEVESVTMARGYDVIFIDYVQLLSPGGKQTNRFESTTEVSMELHKFAQDRKVCVIALSQLSRPDKSSGKNPHRPTMSDLRESGQLEQDADIIMLLSSDSLDPNSPERVLQVPKNKEGRKGIMYLHFDGAHQYFYSRGKKEDGQNDSTGGQNPG